MNGKMQNFIWTKRVQAVSLLPNAHRLKEIQTWITSDEEKKHESQLNIFLKLFLHDQQTCNEGRSSKEFNYVSFVKFPFYEC